MILFARRFIATPSIVLLAAAALLGTVPSAFAEEVQAAPPESAVAADPEVTDAPFPAVADTISTGTLTLLRTLEEFHKDVRDVYGEFDQLKVSEIFLEEIPSTGRFWFRKPDLFRCDYDPPDEMTNLILREAIYVHVPSIEQVEVYKFRSAEERDQQLHSMVIGFGFDTAELIRQYDIRSSEDDDSLKSELATSDLDSDKSALVYMIPRPALLDSSPFTSLKLWIDKETLFPQKVWFEDYNGDKTSIDIREVQLNAEFEETIFDANFPPGTEIIDKTDT